MASNKRQKDGLGKKIRKKAIKWMRDALVYLFIVTMMILGILYLVSKDQFPDFFRFVIDLGVMTGKSLVASMNVTVG